MSVLFHLEAGKSFGGTRRFGLSVKRWGGMKNMDCRMKPRTTIGK